MIEDYFVEAISDDEFVSGDELFSSNEGMFSYNDYIISEYAEEAGVNVIVPHFGVPSPIEIIYRNCNTLGELNCLAFYCKCCR